MSDNAIAKNEAIRFSKDERTGIASFSFGSGTRDFVILPGLSPTMLCDLAELIAKRYEALADDFRITLFDRPEFPPSAYGIKDMASDLASAMKSAGISNATVLGSSQGGMIAQQLAVDYPDAVHALVLCATTCKSCKQTQDIIGTWLAIAEKGDKAALGRQLANDIYSPAVAKSLAGEGLSRMISEISDELLKRFITLGKSCLTFDLSESVSKIKCRTLVIGSKGDKITLPEAAETLAQLIPQSELLMYGSEYGHGIVDEIPNLPEKIKEFALFQNTSKSLGV